MVRNKEKVFFKELKKWNRKINLFSEGDSHVLFERHFIDSIRAVPLIPQGAKVLDIGSGNGFPSVPIALLRPDITMYALESKIKKAAFLNNIKNKLNLKKYNVLNNRIQENLKDFKNFFDIITARAFSSAEDIIKKSIFYGKNKVTYILYKTNKNKELEEAHNNVKKVIHSVDKIVYKLKDNTERCILKIFCEKNND
jgi:16S rRNA (guanine527-N7)-methyltransferase